MGISILDRPSVRRKLMDYGYMPHEEGLKCFIKDKIKDHTLPEVAKMIGVNDISIRNRLVKFGIKNPNKPGGNRNPKGFYGKSGKRRSLDKGVIHHESSKKKEG